MSSPVPVPSSHELDTPVSQGSPINLCSSPKSSIPKLITLCKEEEISNADLASPKINGSIPSGNSSPASSSASPLRLSSPANGILTPPTEGDTGSDCVKSDKSAGRLKFYKDGILCLELSHHNEGERTKWVQIRTKTVFPTVVHATKEATIPCHISPTSFSSPSSVPLQSRVESSTSHSMSDDGSSMLSSPRPREGTWKQPVPQKAISSCLEFFMNPAVCVLNLRSVIKKTSKSQVLRKLLRQFDRVNQASVPDLVSQCDSKSIVCSCSRLNNSLHEDEKDCVASGEDSSPENITKSAPLAVCEPLNIVSRTKRKYVINSTGGVSAVCDRLRNAKESKLLEDASKSTVNSDCSDDSKVPSAKSQAILPKKRVFKEMDSKDLRPPKKKSPTSHKIVHDTRTILNVPGLNSEFYRRHSTQWVDSSSSGLEGQQVPAPSNFPSGFREDKPKGIANSQTRKAFKPTRITPLAKNKTECSSISNHSNISAGAKSSPTRGTPKKATELEFDSKFLNNQIPYSISSAMSLSSLPLQQQEKFLQQQTMSKAISYTISSLLSNPTPCENNIGGSSKNSLLKPNLDAVHSYSEKKLGHNSANGSSGRYSKSKATPSSHQLNHDLSQGNPNLKSDQDQNSFLRHLLDTSDPIPSSIEKCERSNGAGNSERGKQTSWSPNSRTSHSKKSNSNDSRPSSGSDEIRKNSSPSSKPVSHSVKSASSKSSSGHHFAPYPTQFHPSLVNGGFPLSLGAYDAFLRGQQDPQSAALAAAAAAAAFQYQALLPQNVLTNLNSQMAAAMAASYLGGAPNPSRTALSSSRSPPAHPHSSSPINYSSGSPLNLSQRTWSGPGHPNGLHSEPGVIPGQFHASPGDNRHSGRGSPSSVGYSRSRAENTLEVDSDIPLNLSKKPRST